MRPDEGLSRRCLWSGFCQGHDGSLPVEQDYGHGRVAPTEENLTAWIRAGVFCVGMGSKMFPRDVVAAGDWDYITRKCRESLDIIRRAAES